MLLSLIQLSCIIEPNRELVNISSSIDFSLLSNPLNHYYYKYSHED